MEKKVKEKGNIEKTKISKKALNKSKETKLKTKIKELKNKLETQKKEYLISLADLENDRKIFEKSKHEFIKFANEYLISDFINILDTFNMALKIKKPSPEVKNFLVGFEMISKQFSSLFESNGVKPINAKVGDKFDSKLHSSIEEVESKQDQGTITSIIKEGYTINGRLLRSAMVKIAK